MYFYFKILLHCFCDRETWTFNSAPTEGALYVKHPFPEPINIFKLFKSYYNLVWAVQK